MRSSSTARAFQSSFVSKRRWCPICRTATGRRCADAPKQCKLCDDTGMLLNDSTLQFCVKCRTPKGGSRKSVATSDCKDCDGRGMIGGAA